MNKQGNRLPGWLKTRIHTGNGYKKVTDIIQKTGLNTICLESRCPNKPECFAKKEVTFLIAGKNCTRNCKYCNVEPAAKKPKTLDESEPEKIANTVADLGLKYVVVTSVTRDDLEDGGAEHFNKTVKTIMKKNPNIKTEVLIPDFAGNLDHVTSVCKSGALVAGHNVEIAGEYNFVKLRPGANYKTSLNILNEISKNIEYSKSGLMVGLGETMYDIKQTLEHLKQAGVKLVTIGQYLAPSKKHFPVQKYYTPADFKQIEKYANELGFLNVKAGPFIRSSYRAGEIFE